MNRRFYFGIAVVLVATLCGCDRLADYHGTLSQPEQAHLDLSDRTLTKFDADLSRILFRYLAGNPRWEIREERDVQYAVRLERADAGFETTLNGFYSTYEQGAVRQTRVLISFGKEYGFGRERGNITRTKSGDRDADVTVEAEHSGTPGNSSYTIIAGGAVFLEIFDQAPEVVRTFTQNAFNEVSAELRDVIAHRGAIEAGGILPVPNRYPKPLPTKIYFEVKDGVQPGIYLLSASVSPTQPGFVFAKAFNATTGARLSQREIKLRSVRYVGWSEHGKTLFPYGSEVTVYEGDWSSTYEARFELWHRSAAGTEKKLAEKTRTINGWQR